MLRTPATITRMILLQDHPRFLSEFLHRGVERFSSYNPTVDDSNTVHGGYKIRMPMVLRAMHPVLACRRNHISQAHWRIESRG